MELQDGLFVPETQWDLRVRKKVDYNDVSRGSAQYKAEVAAYGEMLSTKTFSPPTHTVMDAGDVTVKYLCESGFRKPILIPKVEGLGMKLPPPSFSVADVTRILGDSFPIDVIDVTTQVQAAGWTMRQWRHYFEHPETRESVLNVISLEFSGTPLGQYVRSPAPVRAIDWIETAWPAHLRASDTYPHIQYYCLMSCEGSFTDFHIDFGGTSVWYHVISGQKRFFMIPPTPENLAKYEEWMLSTETPRPFLGDLVSECFELTLNAGNTVLLPGGWIHAVHTPIDSLVFGGNFLHSLNIQMQLDVLKGEKRLDLPKRFRVPSFTALMWYVAGMALQNSRTDAFAYAVKRYCGDTQDEPADGVATKRFRLKLAEPEAVIGYTKWEVRELPAMVEWLRSSFASWQGQCTDTRASPAGDVSARVAAMEYVVAMTSSKDPVSVLDELEARCLGRSWGVDEPDAGDSGSEHDSDDEIILESSMPLPAVKQEPPVITVKPLVAVKIKLTSVQLKVPEPPPVVQVPSSAVLQVQSDSSSDAGNSEDNDVMESSDEEYNGDGHDDGWVPGHRKRRKKSSGSASKQPPSKKERVSKPAAVPKPPPVTKPKPAVNGIKRLQDKLKALSKKRS